METEENFSTSQKNSVELQSPTPSQTSYPIVDCDPSQNEKCKRKDKPLSCSPHSPHHHNSEPSIATTTTCGEIVCAPTTHNRLGLRSQKQQQIESPIQLDLQITPIHRHSAKPIRKKKKNEQRAGYTTIHLPKSIFARNILHVHCDISITSDLQIRLGGAVAWGLVGIEYLRCTKVTTQESTIEFQMEYSGIPSVTLEEVITKISTLKSPYYQNFHKWLSMFNYFVQNKQLQALNRGLTAKMQDKFFENFCRESYERIAIVSQTESMYGYVIGRCNYFTGKDEVKHKGYSHEFMSLLCLNSDLLSQMYLRNKPINMFIDPVQLQELSLHHMDCRSKKQVQVKSRLQITTIDGYNLWVNQCMDTVIDISEEGLDSNYFHSLSKFDIDIHDLKGLIEYRKSLANSQGMTFDRLVQVELSQMLEDVEYSVQSQLFMEKYYRESVIHLTQMMDERIEKSQKNERKRCGYRIF